MKRIAGFYPPSQLVIGGIFWESLMLFYKTAKGIKGRGKAN
jgi:hypothetical protein